MEGVEAALKSSVMKEMDMKTTSPVYEEFLTTVQNGEDFSVDDLLDLSNDDVFVDDEAEQEMVRVSSVELNENEDVLRRRIEFSCSEDFESLPTSELSVPVDDLANVEWLSNFVEDSFTAPNLTGNLSEKPVWLTGDRKHNPVTLVTEETCFKSPIPVKSRTKRNRNGVKVWSSSSSSSSTSSSSSSELLEPKNHKKRSVESVLRRCSHCGVQKTPQWRAGPMGAKTLCNACGVRFKSGRLLPEYRPACSPTFSSEIHSNHHRKVMEMRKKKEPIDDDDKTGLDQVVQSPRAVPSF